MSEQTTHPSPEELSAFSLGQLPSDAAAAVEIHISDCQPCCETLLGLSSDDTFVELLQEAEQLPTDKTVDQDVVSGDPLSMPDVPGPLAEHPRYEILGLIGKGGMGDVYKARHRMMDRTVALKIINRELVCKPEAVDRFHREVKTAARLSHSNIVTAHDAEQAGDVHFLVMEHVDGIDLAHTVKDRGALPIADACDYVRQAAIGLQYAHEMGMVHRDIKPHNLMVTAGGTVKILDFGLAALAPEVVSDADTVEAHSDLTAAGSIMGTPDFISPEQADNAHQADIRSDIYSLGTTLYYLLSGRPPFVDGSVMHKLKSHAQVEPEPIQDIQTDVPDELAEVLGRMMAKDPAERFQTPSEVADALAPFARESLQPPTEKSDTALQSETKPSESKGRRLPLVTTALLSVVSALIAAAIFYIQLGKTTLKFEVTDQSVEVKFGETSVDFRDREGSGSVFTIKPGTKQTFTVEQNGAVVETGSLVLNRGDKVVLRISVFNGDVKIVPNKDVAINRQQHARPTPTGGTPAPPQPRNYALQFDGESSAVSLPIRYDGSHPITLECTLMILKPIRERNAMLITDTHDSGVLFAVGQKQYAFILARSETQEEPSARSIEPLPAGQVFHVAGVFTGDQIRFYVDGKLQASRDVPDGFRYEKSPMRLAIGANPDGPSSFRGSFNGLIDEVRISKVARYDADFIPEQRFVSDSDTLALYHFDEGVGAIARDSSGNKLHGEVFDAKWVDAPQRPSSNLDSVVRRPAEPSREGIAELRKLEGHPTAVQMIAFLPKDNQLVSAGAGHITKWNTTTGHMHQIETEPSNTRALLVSPDGKQVATGGHDGHVNIFAFDTGQHVLTFSEHAKDRGQIEYMAWSPDGKYIISKSWSADFFSQNEGKAEMILWNATTGEVERRFEQATSAQMLAFSPAGDRIVGGDMDDSPNVWDVKTGKVLFELSGHSAKCKAVAFSNDGAWIATGSRDGTCRIWNANDGRQQRIIHEGDIEIGSLAVLPDDQHIVMASNDHLWLYEVQSGKLVAEVADIRLGDKLALAINSDGSLLATAETQAHFEVNQSSNTDIQLWRLPLQLPEEDAEARAFFRKFERTIQESPAASVIYVGEIVSEKDGTTERKEYWGAYQTAPKFGIAQRRPGGGSSQVGSFEIRGIDTFYDPVSYRFYINPITRSGFGEWGGGGPGLWPVDEFRFTSGERRVPGTRCVQYRLRPSREQSCEVSFWIDEKSLAPRRRTVSYEQDGRRVRFVEEYRGFSTQAFTSGSAVASQLADGLILRGQLSTQIDGQWKPTEWLVNKRVYRADKETEIWYERFGRVVLAKDSTVLINGNDLSLQDGRASISHRTHSAISLILGDLRFNAIPFIAGRSRITASSDRVFIEQGSTVASRGNLEKSVKLHEGVEYLIRDGRPESQPERTLPAEPDWRETERTLFRLEFDQPDAVQKTLVQGEVAEQDGRQVIQSTIQGDAQYSQLDCTLADNESVKLSPSTAIRFRYFFTGKSGGIRLSLHNQTNDKTYEHSLVIPQSRHWTTFQAPLAELNCIGPGPDISKNSRPGDQLDRVKWSVYGRDGTVMIDKLEFLELKQDDTADPWRNVRTDDDEP